MLPDVCFQVDSPFPTVLLIFRDNYVIANNKIRVLNLLRKIKSIIIIKRKDKNFLSERVEFDLLLRKALTLITISTVTLKDYFVKTIKTITPLNAKI